MGSFVIPQCFTNETVNLQCGAVQIQYNIRRINLYKSDTKCKEMSSKNMSDDFNI